MKNVSNTLAGLAWSLLIAVCLAGLLLGGCGERWIDPAIQECRDAGGVAVIEYDIGTAMLRNCAFPCLSPTPGAERFRPGHRVEAPEARP